MEVFREFEDFYRMCLDLLVKGLEDLAREAEGLTSSPQNFYLASEILWRGTSIVDISTQTGGMLREAWVREEFARKIIVRSEGRPRKILEAVRKIEEAIEWCRKGGER